MSENRITLAVAAYKECEFLETAVLSALNQTVPCDVFIVTGTPNDYIRGIAEKYKIPVYVNDAEDAQKAAGNFNFAYKNAKTDLITIVHQDDYYEPQYAEEVLKISEGRSPIIIFSEYYEIRGGEKVYDNKLLKIKRFMDIGFCVFPKSRFVRKRVLSFGCPIAAPAVTLSKKACGDFKFDASYRGGSFDWDAWVRLADLKGEFLCVRKPLLGHRIYENSGTTEFIVNNMRAEDELRILKKMWPEKFAVWYQKKYSAAYASNELDKNNCH